MKLGAPLIALCLVLSVSVPASATRIAIHEDAPHAPARLLLKLSASAALSARQAQRPGVSDGGSGKATLERWGLSSLDAAVAEAEILDARFLHALPAGKSVTSAGTEGDPSGVRRWVVLQTRADTDLAAVAATLVDDPSVEAVTLDYQVFSHAVPNDPQYLDNWGHDNRRQFKSYCVGCGEHDGGDPIGELGFDANAEVAWDEGPGYGDPGVVIAVLDTGVDVDHPDLRLVQGHDVAEMDTDPDDDSGDPGHGTAVAGVAAAIANNALGVAGIAGGCSVMPVKVANDNGGIFLTVVQLGLVYATDHGADVINMSFGAPIADDPATDDALAYAHAAGVVLVASAGNHSEAPMDYPAINAHAIAVGAASPCGERKRGFGDPLGTTCDGEGWWGSNFGDDVQDGAAAIDILGPSMLPTTDVLGSAGLRAGDYHPWFNGTSCAAPYVSGVCALILSGRPTLTPEQVRERLVQSAIDVISVESTSGWDRFSGYGMVDAAMATAGGDHASLPYFTGFEGGALDLHWLAVASPAAKTQVGAAIKPAVGSHALQVETLGTAATAEAWLFVDLENETQVNLEFLCRGRGGADPHDGLYFSSDDGFTFTKVWDFPSDLEDGWNPVRLDVDELAALHGVPLNDKFVLRFCQNSAGPAEFVALDDVLVSGGPGFSTVDLLWPRHNVRLTAGSQVPLHWRVIEGVDHLDLDYSADGGETWQPIERDLPASVPYVWNVPAEATHHGRLRIASSREASSLDLSDDEFQVVKVSTATFSPLPYFTGFELGQLDEHWTVRESGFATTAVTADHGPGNGTYQLVLGSTMDGPLAQSEAWLHLDLAGHDEVALRFSWQDFGDAADPGDGVFFSDDGGATFEKVFDLDGAMVPDFTWQHLTLDLDDLAATAGLSLTSTFVVKLQQVGRQALPADGHGYDDLSVSAVGVRNYATVPYFTGFEAGTLDPFWTVNSEPGGRVQVTSAHGPRDGSFHMTMDTESDNYALNEAWLQLNLFGVTEAYLEFYWKDLSDETHGQDGVYLSDDEGANFVKVLDLFGGFYENDVWSFFQLDLVQLAADHGLDFTNTFVVKFQQVDNSTLPFDGHAYDDVRVVTGGSVGISAPRPSIPRTLTLRGNAPNPFNPRTTIHFELPRAGHVRVGVYDLRGRLVATILDEHRPAGRTAVPWNGQDARGGRVASGRYLYRVEAGGAAATGTMTLAQ